MSLPLFVYGTLRSDCSRGTMLGQRERERATVRGTLWHLPAGYPALELDGQVEVKGELVHDVDDALLTVLDLYEGVSDGLYRRVEVDARVGMTRVRALTYVMDRPWERRGKKVASGFWKERGRVVR